MSTEHASVVLLSWIGIRCESPFNKLLFNDLFPD